ncbi:MAG: ABC transporter ATP-binding protein [Mycobacteriales bacterium]
MTSAAAVDLSDVRVRRGAQEVLHGVTAQIPRGQVVGLLGPSGCGKTTLLRAVVGVQARVTGSVTVLGLPAGTPQLRRQVGYMTQAPSIYGDLTVRQNLRYFGRLLDVDADAVAAVLAQVDLEGVATARVDQVSGGQRARVSLAVALLAGPQLLVLDEPTVGLDPVLREELWAGFRRLADGGCTLLVSSHVMDEAARCDRLLLLRDGALLADELPETLLARTGASTLEQAFLRLVQAP